MTTLETNADYLRLFVVAAVLGVLGGLANELLQTVRGRNGNLRMPKYQKARGLVYLGFLGPLILGAVAAVIVLVFLPLSEQTRTGPGGAIVTDRSYDPLRVVPLSLAAGVAGSAVLTAAQARLVGMVNQQKAEFLEATVGGSLDRAAAAASDKAGEVVTAKMEAIKPKVKQMVAEARAEVPPEFAQELRRQGVSATDVESATAAVPKGPVVVGDRRSSAPSMDVDDLFDTATAEATEAVKATIMARAEAEKAAILRAAQAFADGEDAPRPTVS